MGSPYRIGDDMSRHRIVLSVVIALVLLRAHGVPAMTIKINDTRENNFYLEALNWVLE